MDNIVSALVAYGDTVNMCARDLVWGLAMGNADVDPYAGAARVIVTHTGYVNDTLLNDLISYIDDHEDTYND